MLRGGAYTGHRGDLYASVAQGTTERDLSKADSLFFRYNRDGFGGMVMVVGGSDTMWFEVLLLEGKGLSPRQRVTSWRYSATM